MMTPETLRSMFAYDPETGRLSRIGKGKAVSLRTNADGYLPLCVNYRLGIFDTAEAAHAAYLEAKRAMKPGAIA